jgi:hypothetical protein
VVGRPNFFWLITLLLQEAVAADHNLAVEVAQVGILLLQVLVLVRDPRLR